MDSGLSFELVGDIARGMKQINTRVTRRLCFSEVKNGSLFVPFLGTHHGAPVLFFVCNINTKDSTVLHTPDISLKETFDS